MLYIYKNSKNILEAFKNEDANRKAELLVCHDEKEEKGEKHVPVITANQNEINVTVGSILHPMTEEHLIQDIFLETDKRILHKHLTANEKPIAIFTIDDDEKVIAAYEYCNLHGLWNKKF